MNIPLSWRGALLLLSLLSAPKAQENWFEQLTTEPGPVKPDVFYPGFDPDTDAMPAPRKGGRVIVHLSSLPKNVNYMLDNSAVTRRIGYEIHEYLVQRDWETWEHAPIAAESWVEEDTVILAGGRSEGNGNVVWGKVTEDGDTVRVEPLDPANPNPAREIPRSEVESIQYGTVFTFRIRPGVKWQDGHVLDARDVKFAFDTYMNPAVDCDQVRYKFEKFAACELVDAMTVRFFYTEQYYLALDSFTDLVILPSHLYDLSDPDNPDHDASADGPVDQRTQGEYVNQHPNNTLWVGLGPYRVTTWSDEYIEAERADTYFDPENSGWVDRIRWRHVDSDNAAKQALINGELDYWDRMRPEDYYGEYTRQEEFTEHFYKGLSFFSYMGYTGWNSRKFLFSDPQVRRALNMCFDWDSYIKNVYKDLAVRITGTPFFPGPGYNRDVVPVPFDLDAAEELLLEAGWYDRDGDGIVDKDGVPFEFEFLSDTGNVSSAMFGQALKENLEKVGVRMSIVTREWAAFSELLHSKEFDVCSLAWVIPIESDPQQLWHSSQAPADKRTSNYVGFADDEADRLIGEIQRELDDDKRNALLRQLHARIYELQPYMFGVNLPKKLAISKRIRNYRAYAIDPHYRIRDWFLVEPGTTEGER